MLKQKFKVPRKSKKIHLIFFLRPCIFQWDDRQRASGHFKRACKLKLPAKFSYEATRFFIAEKLLSFFLFTAIRRSSTQVKISLNPNLLSIQAL
jgi:hypothetical protein